MTGKNFCTGPRRAARGVGRGLSYDSLKKKIRNLKDTHCVVSVPFATVTSDLRCDETPNVYAHTLVASALKSDIRKDTLLVLRVAELMAELCRLGLLGSSKLRFGMVRLLFPFLNL